MANPYKASPCHLIRNGLSFPYIKGAFNLVVHMEDRETEITKSLLVKAELQIQNSRHGALKPCNINVMVRTISH
jgi:hypothetical protein